MSRLVTERASRAEAEQRRGRAGRTAPGVCLRLWTQGQEGAMPAFAPPEIAIADLAPLALEVAAWGARDPSALRFPDPPPAAAYAEAQALLRDLGALDAAGAITPHGAAMARAPLHPRLAHMALAAEAQDAATARALAAILSEGDPLRAAGAAPPADIGLRLEAFADAQAFARRRGRALDEGALARARQTARRLGPAGRIDPGAAGRLLALAWPDRIAQRRPGDDPRYLLTGGKGARLPADAALADAPLLAVAETDGDPREARIRLAAPLSRAELDALAGDRIAAEREIVWDARARSVRARSLRRLGALVLDAKPLPDPDPGACAAAMLEGVRALGLGALPWTDAARRLRARIAWAAARDPGGGWPAMDDAALLDAAPDWLGPHVIGMRRASDLDALPLADVLRAMLDHAAQRRLDAMAPAAVATPAGRPAPVDYDREPPAAQVRAQALYGLDRHPAPGVALELLSPAGRPIALTADLPRFWREGWADVRKDMRGRYPRHDWPERPMDAAPTTRARARAR
jgi:ATP-dependent helicase HrpB